MYSRTARVSFISEPIEVTVEVPDEIAEKMQIRDELTLRAMQSTSIEEKSKTYQNLWNINREIKCALKHILTSLGHNPAHIEEWIPTVLEALYDNTKNPDWRRQLVYDFVRLNYTIRDGIAVALGFSNDYTLSDTEWNTEVFMWCEANKKLNELRFEVNKVMGKK